MALKDTYFTISEAAKQLKVTRQTISRWVAKGNIPAEKIGREVLIKRGDLHKYHSTKVGRFVADSVTSLCLSAVEDYAREKGYGTRDGEYIKYLDKDEPLEPGYHRLTDEEKAEIVTRLKPILEGFLKDVSQNVGLMGNLPKDKQKAIRQRRKIK